MWELYDELIAAVPEDAVVADCLAGLSWFLVRSEGAGLAGTGVAMRPRDMDGPVRNAGRIRGMKLKELASATAARCWTRPGHRMCSPACRRNCGASGWP
jgi:hypothetical protein